MPKFTASFGECGFKSLSTAEIFLFNHVILARKEEIEPHGDLILGVGPAGGGTDFTAIAWRRGHCVTKIEKRRDLDTMQTVGWIASIIREDAPARVNLDVGGLGIGIYDRLLEQGHSRSLINAVNFADSRSSLLR